MDSNVAVSNPMHLYINVFHLAMELWVPENLECGLVVNHEWRGSGDVVTNFLHEHAHPDDIPSST